MPPSVLAPYQEHLNARWVEGERSALVLYREIRALGYSRSSRPVSRWAQGRRTEPHPRTPRKYLPALREPVESVPQRGRLPSARKLAWLLVRDPEALDASETAVLDHVRQDVEVARLYDLSRSYNRLVRDKRPADLDGWLDSSRTSGISALVTFSEGLRRDYDAVRAALEEPWSSGQAEGQINRLKMLKRQMYAAPASTCSASVFCARRDHTKCGRARTGFTPASGGVVAKTASSSASTIAWRASSE